VALLLSVALMANAARAQEPPGWSADRAEWFADVCMGSAPDFANMQDYAAKAGFSLQNGHLMHAPEVAVSLRSVEGGCACYMTMGAYNLNEVVQAIFERLVQDYPAAWRPDTQSGTINDTYFERKGERVRLLLVPAELDGADWIAAHVINSGDCPV